MINTDEKILFLRDFAAESSVQLNIDMFQENLTLKEKARAIRKAKEHIDEELKKCQSPIEKMLYLLCVWASSSEPCVSSDSITTQKKIGNYKADVYFTIMNRKIVLEADGHEFHEKTKEQARHDKERDRYIQAQGISIYRFTGSEIFSNTLDVYIEIANIISSEEDIAMEDSSDE